MLKYKKVLCLFLSVYLLLLSGCKKKTETTTTVNPEKKILMWDIYDPYSLLTSDWNSYPILKSISDDVNITPKIRIIRENCDSVFAKTVLSGNYPDLITFYQTDSNLIKAFSSYPFIKFTDNYSLSGKIPENILNHHFKSTEPWCIPGGFTDEKQQFNIPSEGIFVKTNAYNEYGKQISSFEDLISFISYYSSNENATTENLVQLGADGLQTICHLSGINSSDLQYNDEKLPSGVKSILNNLSALNAKTYNTYEDFNLSSIPLVFIGEKSAVNKWSMAYSVPLFTEIGIKLTQTGFLQKYSSYGMYATLITDNKNKDYSFSMISELLKISVSKKMMCGEENTDWIVDQKTGKTFYIGNSENKVSKYNKFYTSNSGVSLFPYLNSFCPVYPGNINITSDLLENAYSISDKISEQYSKQ